MGLDMYLKADRFIFSSEAKPSIDLIPEGYEVESISIAAAYWRKQNAIHDWFVQNVQEGIDECQRVDVSRDKLAELVQVCTEVLADHELAPELLPTTSGFFFGSTEYDDWYFQGLEYTVQRLTALLRDLPAPHWDFTYCSSW